MFQVNLAHFGGINIKNQEHAQGNSKNQLFKNNNTSSSSHKSNHNLQEFFSQKCGPYEGSN